MGRLLSCYAEKNKKPSQMDIYQQRVSRNLGIISASCQEKIQHCTVALAGCGAGGGATAVSLARLGFRRFLLSDPDVVDVSNINRQEGAFISTIGQNKAGVIAREILDIDKDAQVQVYQQGITPENVDDFISKADVVIEEVDYRNPSTTLLIHQVSRKLSKPIFTGIPVAWNAFLFFFSPDGMTYEEYTGLGDTDSGDIKSTDVCVSAYVPEPPYYLGETLLRSVLNEEMDIPAVDPGVRLASALTSSHVYYFVTGEKEILPVPQYYSAKDLFTKDASVLDQNQTNEINRLINN